METYNFYAAYTHLNDFYGISMSTDQFESVALHAWDHIGNKSYQLYTYCGTPENNKLELPCNLSIIEGVFRNEPDVTRTDGISWFGPEIRNQIIQNYVNNKKFNMSEFYNSGGFVKYELVDNVLHIKDLCGDVIVLYKGIIADEEGLPRLNFKEVDAIAKYCAFVEMQKKAMISKDKNTLELAMLMRQQWQFACDDARTPLYLNQNDINKILDVQTSWDRKRFGLSFKMIR